MDVLKEEGKQSLRKTLSKAKTSLRNTFENLSYGTEEY
jgi:hypothetical protein